MHMDLCDDCVYLIFLYVPPAVHLLRVNRQWNKILQNIIWNLFFIVRYPTIAIALQYPCNQMLWWALAESRRVHQWRKQPFVEKYFDKILLVIEREQSDTSAVVYIQRTDFQNLYSIVWHKRAAVGCSGGATIHMDAVGGFSHIQIFLGSWCKCVKRLFILGEVHQQVHLLFSELNPHGGVEIKK